MILLDAYGEVYLIDPALIYDPFPEIREKMYMQVKS